MAAGRIEILRRTYTETPGRRTETAPEAFYSAWCDIGSLYGKELYQALSIELHSTIIFEVRYCKKIKEVWKHLKEFVIRYDGDLYDIYAVDFKKNERDKVQLKANRAE